MSAISRIFGGEESGEAVDEVVEPPTPAEIVDPVRLPAALVAARRRWSDLKRRHADLQQELRSAVIELDSVPQALRPEFERKVNEIDVRIVQLGSQVRDALAEVASATPSFAAAGEWALAPMRSQAAAAAVNAIDVLAAAMSTLGEIDNELRRLGGGTWELRRISPDLGNLRRRIIGLGNG